MHRGHERLGGCEDRTHRAAGNIDRAQDCSLQDCVVGAMCGAALTLLLGYFCVDQLTRRDCDFCRHLRGIKSIETRWSRVVAWQEPDRGRR